MYGAALCEPRNFFLLLSFPFTRFLGFCFLHARTPLHNPTAHLSLEVKVWSFLFGPSILPSLSPSLLSSLSLSLPVSPLFASFRSAPVRLLWSFAAPMYTLVAYSIEVVVPLCNGQSISVQP